MSALARALAVAGLVLAAGPPAVAAQVVTGKVVRSILAAPLGDVTVRLRFPDGRPAAAAVTDSTGRFVIHAPRIGRFTLLAERIGLATVTTSELEIRASEEVEVVLRMAEQAIPLDPLVVEARSAMDIGPLSGYFARMQRQETLGFGHVLSRDQIDERAAVDVADLLRDVPRVMVVPQRAGRPPAIVLIGRGGQCTPKVYIDGVHQNRGGAAGAAAVVDESVRPSDLEGVEVYRGLGEMPGEYYDENHCGVILLWTRRDATGGGPTSRNRILLGFLALLGFGLLLRR